MLLNRPLETVIQTRADFDIKMAAVSRVVWSVLVRPAIKLQLLDLPSVLYVLSSDLVSCFILIPNEF